MPSDLGIAFLDHNAQLEKQKHRSIQFSGCYCLSSAESWTYRPKYVPHAPKGCKVGKSISIARRMNEYMLYYPYQHPGMNNHCLLCMPHAQIKEQRSNVDRCETYLLATFKEQYPNHNN